jgi:SAM-dependent methyltransferase
MTNIDTIADFTYNGQRFLLKTSKFDEHLSYLFWQTGGGFYWDNYPQHSNYQRGFIKDLAKQRFNEWIRYNPSDNIKSIIDVGSGLAISDLLISQLRPDIDFYLIDKTVNESTFDDVMKNKNNYFSKSLDDENYHGFYNSFDVTKDIIQNSPINPERIHFLDPADKWPEQVDLVTSTYSWCFHYHKDVYWNQLLQSLKIGGYLGLSITLRNGEHTIKEISNELGSYPCFIEIWPPDVLLQRQNNAPGFDQITHAGQYLWQRLK